jgi:undecaprenyl-diphosphatase
MNLNIWQTMFLALLQGVTELFPISSLGHTVILPGLLGWGDLVRNDSFLPLIVALHLGTSIALVLYFWRDWLQVVRTLITSVKEGEVRTGTEEWVSWLIIIGCIPAGLLGIFLEKPLKLLFASPLIAAALLVVNGSLLFAGERLRRRAEAKALGLSSQKEEVSGFPAPRWEALGLPRERREALGLPTRMWEGQPRQERARPGPADGLKADEHPRSFRPLASLTWKEALLVGLAQSLALLPGISRSGATMVAGLGVRLNHEDAARYSFLLGTPLIGAAALLEVPQLLGQSASTLLLVGMGMVLAGVAAYLSTRFLMKYFETGRLDPFAYYCWAAGLVALIVLLAVLHTGG